MSCSFRPIRSWIEVDDMGVGLRRNLRANKGLVGCFVTGIAILEGKAIRLIERRLVLRLNGFFKLL